MRTIKFRAKRLMNGSWVYGDLHLLAVHPHIHPAKGVSYLIKEDTIGDFTAMPFPDSSFKMVVFDPPHLVWAGKAANLYKRFGILNKDWKEELAMGFKECFRVLEPYGVLIFKWCETQLKLKTVLALTDEKPLFGHKRGKTFWVAFMKFPKQ